METSLITLQRQVEKETAQGLSWDTVVQLRTLQGLTEVSSQLEVLSKVLAELLADVRAKDGLAASSSPERGRGFEEPGHSGIHPSPEPGNGKGRRGRPRKAGRQDPPSFD